MSKFKVGDKVLVTGSTYRPVDYTRAMIGSVCEIKAERDDEGQTQIWNASKSDYGNFNDGDFQHYTETPKEITLNGAIYVLKEEPKPEHEWKFGDIAVHEEFGVGIVFGVDGNNSVCFKEKTTLRMVWRNTSKLTFLRRADLSV